MQNKLIKSFLPEEFIVIYLSRFLIKNSEFVSSMIITQFIKRQFKLSIFLIFTLPLFTYANHEPASVSDIDHIGMGIFEGSYTHSLTDHVWCVFNANAGDAITLTVSTPDWLSTVWMYRANDNCIDIGDDSFNNNCLVFVQQFGEGQFSFTYTIVTLFSGQYAFQLDSYEGGSGAYIVDISGSTATTILCTGNCISGDLCPNDPNKTNPGQCGCGIADIDTDNDGTADCNDGCPNDPNKLDPGSCGCGNIDEDTDCDGIADCNDRCPGGDDRFDYDNDGIPDCKDLPPYAMIQASWKCGNNKVYICHKPIGNINGGKTLCVSYNALQAHLNHGDYLGECGNANCGLIVGDDDENDDDENGKDQDDHGHGDQGQGHGHDLKSIHNGSLPKGKNERTISNWFYSDEEIILFPNPAQDLLYVKLPFNTYSNIQINLFNSMGKKLFNQMYPGNNEDGTVIPFNTKSYSSGLYFIETIVDGKRQIKTFSILK